MKKLFVLLLSLCFCFGLAACGGDTGGGSEPADDPEAGGAPELLSAPYAEMLKSGDYKYTYTLDYEGAPYTATIASYNGINCRKVVADDNSYAIRVVTIDGNAWAVDELTGAVEDMGAEGADTFPDYAATLTYVETTTSESGEITEAYSFEYEGQPGTLDFVFTREGELVKGVLALGDQASETELLTISAAGNDRSLFDAPQ